MSNAAYDYCDMQDAPEAGERHSAALTTVALEDVPEAHPVRRFASAYFSLVEPPLLPHANVFLQDPTLTEVFGWTSLIEPIELNGAVDFKIIRQGNKLATSEGVVYRDKWMCDTVDPEFLRATYSEVIAASVLRKPLFSRGRVPHQARAFLYMLRGIFPVFADNQARLRLFKVEAQPYVVV